MKKLLILFLLTIIFSQNYNLRFDGNDDFIEIDPVFNGIESTYSIFFDINIYSFEYGGAIFIHRQHNNDKVFHIGCDSGDCTENQVITFKDLYNAEWLISGHLNTNQWYNIGVVSNEDNISLYVDGEIVSSGSRSNESDWGYPHEGHVFLGGLNNDNHMGFTDCNLDNFSIWDKALSENEINEVLTDTFSYSDSNLIFFSDFNSGEGEILYDQSGSQNHGTIYGAEWIENLDNSYGCTDSLAENYNSEATIDDGSCYYIDNGDYLLYFDGGPDDYVTINSTVIDSYPLTITAEIFIENLQVANILLSEDNTWCWYIRNPGDGSMHLEMYNNINSHTWVRNEYIFNEGQWYDIAIVIDENNNVAQYVNGEAIPMVYNDLSPLSFTDNNITLGHWSQDEETFDGLFNNVKVWSRALTTDEILANLNGELSDNLNLSAEYKFNAGSDEMLYDHSGNQNHGTIYGAEWVENDLDPNTHLVPDEYDTIQSAIDAASDGDTVHVSSGTYYENLNFFSNNITLIGENSENTIIDGGGTGSVVTFNNVSGLVIDNFTITNGNNFNGGGIYSNFSSSKILNCKIIDNIGVEGAGIKCDQSPSIEITNCSIIDNVASGNGGGLCLANSTADISSSTISNNNSNRGGGAFVYNSNISTKYCVFDSNTDWDRGGAISLLENSSSNINQSTFINNVSERNNTGSAIDAQNSFIDMNNSIVYLHDGDPINYSNSSVNFAYSNFVDFNLNP